MKRLLFLFCIYSIQAFAGSKLQALDFPVDKNGILLLPQKFEYTLYPNETLKLGFILIDFNQLEASFIKGISKNNYQLKFKWPHELISSGKILIKSNIGKSIISFPIENSEKISPSVFTSDNFNESIFNEIKNSLFFNVCAYYEQTHSRVMLCTSNLNIKNEPDPEIKTQVRNDSAIESKININGASVGNQGIVFLSNSSETISFSANLKNGSSLEIETRRRDITFHDVIYNSKTKQTLLTVSGSEPIEKDISQKAQNNKWLIKLPPQKTSIYFYGDANIPMRQEFFINGSIPEIKDRVFFENKVKNIEKTYSSNTQFILHSPNGVTLSAQDNSDQVTQIQPNKFEWKITGLEKGRLNQKLILVQRDSNLYLAQVNLERGYPFEFDLVGSYLFPKQNPYADIKFTWWPSDFPSHLHWGINLSHSQHLLNKEGNINIDSNSFEILYKWNSGLTYSDNFLALGLFYENTSASELSQNQLGVSLLYQSSSPASFQLFSTWYEIYLKYAANKLLFENDFLHLSNLRLGSLLKMTDQFIFQYGINANLYQSQTYDIGTEIGGFMGAKLLF